jgi:hypothetical protein
LTISQCWPTWMPPGTLKAPETAARAAQLHLVEGDLGPGLAQVGEELDRARAVGVHREVVDRVAHDLHALVERPEVARLGVVPLRGQRDRAAVGGLDREVLALQREVLRPRAHREPDLEQHPLRASVALPGDGQASERHLDSGWPGDNYEVTTGCGHAAEQAVVVTFEGYSLASFSPVVSARSECCARRRLI